MANFRGTAEIIMLGKNDNGAPVDNARNFPEGSVEEKGARWIYEIVNPLSFAGPPILIPPGRKQGLKTLI